MRTPLVRVALLAVLAAAPGCDKVKAILEASGGGGGGSASFGGGGGGAPAKGAGPRCPSKSRVEVGAAQQKTELRADETWTADHTYVVYGEFELNNFALTVEAGTTICFENDPNRPNSPLRGRLIVSQGARLRMLGAPDKRITLTHMRPGRESSEPFHVRSGYGEFTLHHVDVYDAGSRDAPALQMYADKGPPVDLRDVTFHSIRHKGIQLLNRTGLTPESSLSIVLATTTGDGEYPILEVDPMAAGSLSQKTLHVSDKVPTSMRYIQINVREIGRSVTWRDTGVPYRAYRTGQELITDVSGSSATLTIEAGTTIQMPPESSMLVGGRGSREGMAGDLIAVGTAERPITFTSAKRPPAAGDWSAIVFRGGTFDPSVSRLEHVKVEYGGLVGGNTLYNCADGRNDIGGLVLIDHPPMPGAYNGPVIRASQFAHSTGDGIRPYCQTPPARECIKQDYSAPELGNTFNDMGSGKGVPSRCRAPI